VQSVLFLNVICPLVNAYCIAYISFVITSVKKVFGCDQSHICTVSLTASLLANLCPCKASFSGPDM
jgi:hypothetical protein